MIVLVQTTNGYSNHYKGGLWSRADFASINLTQAGMTIIGIVTTVMSAAASHFPQDTTTPTKVNLDISSRNTNNAGLLGSGLLAGGIAAFMIGALNFATYGYIALSVASMVRLYLKSIQEINITCSLHDKSIASVLLLKKMLESFRL